MIKHEEERVRQKIGYDQAPLNAVGTTDLDNNHNSDSESEDESSQNKTSLLPKKQPERKTRAQRNKEKNRSKRQYELIQKQKEKKFLKSIHQVPKLVKEIEKEETEQEIKRNALQNLIKQTKEEEQNQLTYREAGVIPLSDELHGNLRQIKPKGLPVREQVNSMIKSGDMMAKGRRKRRKGENPHAGKRVKWIPKYKYGI